MLEWRGEGLELQVPVEGAVLDGFEDVGCLHLRCAFQIGEGAGHFEDPVVGAGGEIEMFHRLLEELGRFGIESAVELYEPRRHGGIGSDAGPLTKALALNFAGIEDAGADRLRFFPRS